MYGAGVMLWEAITGRELFGIDAPEAIVKKQLAGRIAKAVPPAREKWASALLPVVDRALAVDPQDRYASIAELAGAMRIAVRARLMTHEDVVEEIWPAATTPKVQSGVQPASDPIVADAFAPLVVPTPSEVFVSPPPDVHVPIAPPAPRRKAFVALAASMVVAVGALGILSVIQCPRSAHHAVRISPDVAPAWQSPVDPARPQAQRRRIEREGVKPVQAPRLR